jgi:hypothetical protein
MTAIRKFWRLGAAERWLLFDAGISIAVFRIALWILPWSRVSAMRWNRGVSRVGRFSVERLEWAVRNASRVVPGASCLTQALALHHLMTRAGYASSIHIGVAKVPERGFQAHAWVEHGGMTLLNSAGEVAHYARLIALDPPSV